MKVCSGYRKWKMVRFVFAKVRMIIPETFTSDLWNECGEPMLMTSESTYYADFGLTFSKGILEIERSVFFVIA